LGEAHVIEGVFLSSTLCWLRSLKEQKDHEKCTNKSLKQEM
jgi:hypothetical protein